MIPSLHQVMIQVHSDADISLTTGTVEGSPAFMRRTCLLVSPAVVDLDEGKTAIQVTNPNNHTFTLDANTTLTHLRIPTPHQAANITAVPVEHLNLITKYPDEAEAVINQLFVNPEMKATMWQSGTQPQGRAASQTNSTQLSDEYTMRFWHCKNSRSLTRPNPINNITTHKLPEELQLGRLTSYSVSTVTDRGVAGKVQLHFR